MMNMIMINIIGHCEEFDQVDDKSNDSSLENGDGDIYMDEN